MILHKPRINASEYPIVAGYRHFIPFPMDGKGLLCQCGRRQERGFDAIPKPLWCFSIV